MVDDAGAAEVRARWLDALQRVAGRAAHEINNALNGAVVNLEVVRLRAVPGKDAGGVASFAAAGAAQLEAAVRLVEALTALVREPRGGADVTAAVRQLAVLLAPVAAHDDVTLVVDGETEALATAALPAAVRWACAEALLAALAASAPAPAPPSAAAESGGLDGAIPAPVTERVVRCVLLAAPDPTVRIETSVSVHLADDVGDVLRTCGIDVGYEGTALILAFPPFAG